MITIVIRLQSYTEIDILQIFIREILIDVINMDIDFIYNDG